MSSSTSSSDQAATLAWRRFARRVVVLAAVLSAATLAVAVALDPYDTGRFALAHKQGTTETGGRIGDASRIHDEAFDAAIFGNSHVMSLDTNRLSSGTGRRFAMLAIQGTGVREQMTMLDAYLRRHSPPKALIIGVDWLYCLDDPRVSPEQPFPTWLYADDPLSYASHLFGLHTFEVLGRRLLFLFGFMKPEVRDGMVDIFRGVSHTPEEGKKAVAIPLPDFTGQKSQPAFRDLATRLDRLSGTDVVLLVPPIATPALPLAGTPAAAALQACTARARDLAHGRPHVRVVDWLKATPETEDSANFWDATHYYDKVARLVEAEIASAFEGLRSARAAAP